MRSKGSISSISWKYFPIISIFVLQKNFVPLCLCDFVSKKYCKHFTFVAFCLCFNPFASLPLCAKQTTNNKQQTTNNKQQITNAKRQTTNTKHQTPNNKQQTTNNKHQTPNTKRQTPNNKHFLSYSHISFIYSHLSICSAVISVSKNICLDCASNTYKTPNLLPAFNENACTSF